MYQVYVYICINLWKATTNLERLVHWGRLVLCNGVRDDLIMHDVIVMSVVGQDFIMNEVDVTNFTNNIYHNCHWMHLEIINTPYVC